MAGGQVELDLHQGNHRPAEATTYPRGTLLACWTSRAGWFDTEVDETGRTWEGAPSSSVGRIQLDLHRFNHCVRWISCDGFEAARAAYLGGLRESSSAVVQDAITGNAIDDWQVRERYLANARRMQGVALFCLVSALVTSIRNGLHRLTPWPQKGASHHA